MKCKKVFHGASKGRLCRSNRRAVRVFGDALRDWQRLVRAPRRAFREDDRADRIPHRTRRNLIHIPCKMFASPARCSRPSAKSSGHPRLWPGHPQLVPPPFASGSHPPQVDPASREPCRIVCKLIPVVRDAVRGQNSTVWGFREAENACFLKVRRRF